MQSRPKQSGKGAGSTKTASSPAHDKSTVQQPTAAEAVDEQLARYRAMRDFATTAEPSGGGPHSAATALPFVIQKHAATRLHYDFRLGWNGVLKSWACAKGPSYVTRDRRLAVEVEDHPMEYGGFEGAIPKGQYGGGTVLLWDQGTWEPHGDVDEGLRKGSLKFSLHGTKLQGKWTLVRMGGHAAQESKPNWLLIKEHDEFERSPDAEAITDTEPDSVVTGRNLEQIAAAADHTWNSKEADGKAPANHSRLAKARLQSTVPIPAKAKDSESPAPREAASATHPLLSTRLSNAPAEPFPGFLVPQLATSAHRAPAGGDWLHELKLDGYRVQLHVQREPTSKQTAATENRVSLYTRNGLDWTHRMASVAAAAATLPVEAAILDGEVVVLDAQGCSSFSQLQAAFDEGAPHPMTCFVFDLLHLDGHNLRGLPLRDRKTLLEQLLAQRHKPDEALRYGEHVEGAGSGPEIFSQACSLGAEGIIAKQAASRYSGGRSDSWLKLKCVRRQEFVIGGFTLPGDRGQGLGSLLLGYYDGEELLHCGRTGTGFSQATQRMLRPRLEALRAPKAPYANKLTALARKDAVWVRPELVCEVEFATWTGDGLIRHASFQGLREDKAPREVVKEDTGPAMKQQRHKADDAEGAGQPEASAQPEKAPEEPFPTRRERAAGLRATRDKGSNDDGPEEEKSPAGLLTPGLLAKKRPVAPLSTAKASAAATRPPSEPASTSRPPSVYATNLPSQSGNQTAAQAPPSKPPKPQAKNSPATVAGVRLTHPDKILDPESGVTKQQLAIYYEAVAAAMLPHIAERPSSIVRCPDGATNPCFFQKHAAVGLPKSVGSVEVRDKKTGKAEDYISVDTAEALVSLAQLGVLEVHPWGSRNQSLEVPDRLIFDLDPDEALGWPKLVSSARAIRAFLQELKLESFVKTTGGKGLHLVVPIAPAPNQPGIEWPQIKLFCRGVAAAIESSDPKLYLIKMTKSARKGRIFVDYLRNERGATAVAPYSPRARSGMRVALPLDWDELDAGMPGYSLANLDTWRDRLNHDPWAAMPLTRQTIRPEILAAVIDAAGKA